MPAQIIVTLRDGVSYEEACELADVFRTVYPAEVATADTHPEPMLEPPDQEHDREWAMDVLRAREGTPDEHLEHARTEDLVAAAEAPAGQPCGDCGKLVVYRDNDWHHVDTPTGCFLARRDER